MAVRQPRDRCRRTVRNEEPCTPLPWRGEGQGVRGVSAPGELRARHLNAKLRTKLRAFMLTTRRPGRSLVVSLTMVVAGLWLYCRAGFTGRAWQADVQYGVVVSKNIMVPMRDGVRLATDVYRPAVGGVPAPGKFPTILERTPYGKTAGWATYFVSHGYVAVAQDERGRFDSEGSWQPLRDDGNDGYDTAKWIGEQPWSDGGIGTVGTSDPGGTQHALALSNPPYLKTMIPVDAMSDYGRYRVRHNGAFELRWLNSIFNPGLP